jgi:hypothetical protein
MYKKTKLEELRLALPTITEIIFRQWAISMDKFWKYDPNLTVQERFDYLGNKSAEVFQYNTLLFEFLVTNLTGKRDDLVVKMMEKLEMIQPYTINQDGTITIHREPNPS